MIRSLAYPRSRRIKREATRYASGAPHVLTALVEDEMKLGTNISQVPRNFNLPASGFSDTDFVSDLA